MFNSNIMTRLSRCKVFAPLHCSANEAPEKPLRPETMIGARSPLQHALWDSGGQTLIAQFPSLLKVIYWRMTEKQRGILAHKITLVCAVRVISSELRGTCLSRPCGFMNCPWERNSILNNCERTALYFFSSNLVMFSLDIAMKLYLERHLRGKHLFNDDIDVLYRHKRSLP